MDDTQLAEQILDSRRGLVKGVGLKLKGNRPFNSQSSASHPPGTQTIQVDLAMQ